MNPRQKTRFQTGVLSARNVSFDSQLVSKGGFQLPESEFLGTIEMLGRTDAVRRLILPQGHSLARLTWKTVLKKGGVFVNYFCTSQRGGKA